ncbi:5692_t:CDS:2 [Diversispora eburnea]|uniref:5692_t:CDS:1 n=1 Tax=Diversispora eburnea TaxID=1213867 RepID=A0A9N8UZN3_9GLOM|nr:5692_t:CDS:2 [Diversispora eburnea]
MTEGALKTHQLDSNKSPVSTDEPFYTPLEEQQLQQTQRQQLSSSSITSLPQQRELQQKLYNDQEKEEAAAEIFNEENNFLDELDELTLKKRVMELEKTMEQIQKSDIIRRISEIEKALEQIQAEVSASHERIEGLRRELIEREEKIQKMKRTKSVLTDFKSA